MKAIQFIKLIIIFICIIACKNNDSKTANKNDFDSSIAVKTSIKADTFQTEKVIAHVTCAADAGQSYALYIPSKKNKDALPVIYFFDPHGDGSLPLDKYKSLADKYNFILIGSNNSKNGNDWSIAENIWNTLFADTKKRLKTNSNRIYVCGFSGGAKVATYLALNHKEIKGVIANGAGLPDIDHATDIHFSFTAITGEGDMNMTDLVTITNDIAQTQIRHRIIFFDGIHEWAPESTMNIAFAALQFDGMYKKSIPLNNSFIKNYIDSSKKRIENFLQKNNYVRAEEECTLSISLLDGVTDEVNRFKEKDVSIKNNVEYKKQQQATQNLFVKEQNIKGIYQQQFEQGDKDYWTKTINDIKAKTKTQSPERAMYQRLQAYLSLAFYSISNQLINANKNDDAQYFDNLYKLVDPTNSEAWYFSAILDARNNNAFATKNDLLKAIANGFLDKNRMELQPEFQNTQLLLNLNEIESKMK